MKKIKLLGFIILFTVFTNCEKLLINEDVGESPVEIFEDFWSIYNKHYANFVVKNLDWDDVYSKYRPKVTNNISNDNLSEILGSIITEELKDGHCFIVVSPEKVISYWPSSNHFISYHNRVKQVTFEQEGHLYLDYGVIKSNQNIGYIDSKSFEPDDGFEFEDFKKEVDKAMSFCKNKEYIILDARNHLGGQSSWGEYLTGKFSTTSFDYAVERRRINEDRSVLKTSGQKYRVAPQGDFQFTKKVILLTNRRTGSAGELFTLSMKKLPNVTTVGDITFGIFSGSFFRELPNGWIIRVSVGEVKTLDGTSYEGKGIPPDVQVIGTEEQAIDGRDVILEKALEILKQKT